MIRTVNTGEVTAALVALLRAHQPLADMGATVEDAEPVNSSPERCPWVGVYRERVGFPSRTLGRGAGYRRQEVALALALNASSVESGMDCKDRLEALVQEVVSAMCNDESLRGTVDMLQNVEVIYSNYAEVGASFFQEAVIRLDAVTNVIAS